MKKSLAPSVEIDELLKKFRPKAPDLEFPIEPDFISESPRLPLDVVFRCCEESLPWVTSRPGFEEHRWEMKVDKEFIL